MNLELLFTDYWWIWPIIFVVITGISVFLYIKDQKTPKSQFVGTSIGCLGCLFTIMNAISIISGALTIITFLSKILNKGI